MSNTKKHFAVFEVTDGKRVHLGDCFGDRPSRCLRKIATKNIHNGKSNNLGKHRTIDIEEIRPGAAERPVIRYEIVNALRPTTASKRKFKLEHNIGDPDHEIKTEIISRKEMTRKGNTMTPSSTKSVSPTKQSKKARSSSPGRRMIANPPGANGYSFNLLSAEPRKRVYSALLDNKPLKWTDAVANLTFENSSFSPALQKLIASMSRSFGGKEFALTSTFSKSQPKFEIEFRQLDRVDSAEKPSFAEYSEMVSHRRKELPGNVVQINSILGGPKTFVPKPVGSGKIDRYGNLAKFFASSTKQTKALLAELAHEAIRQLEASPTIVLNGSSRPIPWVQFQIVVPEPPVNKLRSM